MELYWKVIAAVLIAAVFGLVMGKDMVLMLSIAVCAMGTVVAIHYIRPVISFIQQLESLAGVDRDCLAILLKVLGIGLTTEIAGMVCSDAGSNALGKVLKIVSCAAVLWIALPVLQESISLLQQILGGI